FRSYTKIASTSPINSTTTRPSPSAGSRNESGSRDGGRSGGGCVGTITGVAVGDGVNVGVTVGGTIWLSTSGVASTPPSCVGVGDGIGVSVGVGDGSGVLVGASPCGTMIWSPRFNGACADVGSNSIQP